MKIKMYWNTLQKIFFMNSTETNMNICNLTVKWNLYPISRICTPHLKFVSYISNLHSIFKNLHSISRTFTLYFELAIFIDVWCMNFRAVGTKKKLLNTKVIIYHFFTIFIRNKAFTRRIFAWIPNWITSYTMTTRGLWISIPSSWKTSKSIQYRISFRFHVFFVYNA